MIKLGPILKFLGCQNNRWGLSVLAVTPLGDAAPSLSVSGLAKVAPLQLRRLPLSQSVVWRWDFSLPQTASEQAVSYQLDGITYGFAVPAKGAIPVLAYASCNGFSDPKLMKQVAQKNALWSRMARLHAGTDTVRERRFGPQHILLLGGDQIYSDTLWHDLPSIAAWCDQNWSLRAKASFTKTMQTELQGFFENLYLSRWAQPEVRAMMAAVPSVMMWDDHDIFDGWGSYPKEQHNCPVYQGIFGVATDYFKLFQLQATDVPPPATLPGQAHFSNAYRIGGLGLLVLDMRSERSPRNDDRQRFCPDQVLSETSWAAVYRWLDAQTDLQHLLIMSSIPVVHPSFEALEKMLAFLPGQQELEDDLRDHWTSHSHREERLRFIHRLLRLSAEKSCRVTLLSGDVHVAAVGVIESDRNDVAPNARVINQLTSSGIVHPAPVATARYFLEQACKQVETIDRGVSAKMLEFPATSRRIIGARNFLLMTPDPQGRLWANWWVEGEANPYTKVIHPVQTSSQSSEVVAPVG